MTPLLGLLERWQAMGTEAPGNTTAWFSGGSHRLTGVGCREPQDMLGSIPSAAG